jgi:hypothetical protein
MDRQTLVIIHMHTNEMYMIADYAVIQYVKIFASKHKQINTTAIYVTKHNLFHNKFHNTCMITYYVLGTIILTLTTITSTSFFL